MKKVGGDRAWPSATFAWHPVYWSRFGTRFRSPFERVVSRAGTNMECQYVRENVNGLLLLEISIFLYNVHRSFCKVNRFPFKLKPRFRVQRSRFEVCRGLIFLSFPLLCHFTYAIARSSWKYRSVSDQLKHSILSDSRIGEMPLGWKATDVPGTFSRIMPACDRIKTEWTDSSKETLTTLDPLRRESTGNTTLSCKFRVILDPSRINLKPRIFGTLTRNVFRSIEEEKGTSRKGKGAIKISITSRLLPSFWRSIALLSPLRLRRVSIKSNEILDSVVGRARPRYLLRRAWIF